jgi:hypothetical protein
MAAAYACRPREVLVNQGLWEQASRDDLTAALLDELGRALWDRYGDGAALFGYFTIA